VCGDAVGDNAVVDDRRVVAVVVDLRTPFQSASWGKRDGTREACLDRVDFAVELVGDHRVVAVDLRAPHQSASWGGRNGRGSVRRSRR